MAKARAPSRRSHSNDGTPSSVSAVVPLGRGLMAKLAASFYEPIVRRSARVFNGPKPYCERGSKGRRFTDEQFIAMRKLRDWYGLTFGQISRLTGLEECTVASVCQYRSRLHLDPGKRPVDLPPMEAQVRVIQSDDLDR